MEVSVVPVPLSSSGALHPQCGPGWGWSTYQCFVPHLTLKMSQMQVSLRSQLSPPCSPASRFPLEAGGSEQDTHHVFQVGIHPQLWRLKMALNAVVRLINEVSLLVELRSFHLLPLKIVKTETSVKPLQVLEGGRKEKSEQADVLRLWKIIKQDVPCVNAEWYITGNSVS